MPGMAFSMGALTHLILTRVGSAGQGWEVGGKLSAERIGEARHDNCWGEHLQQLKAQRLREVVKWAPTVPKQPNYLLQLQNCIEATLTRFLDAMMNKHLPPSEEKKTIRSYAETKSTKQQTKAGSTHLALVPQIKIFLKIYLLGEREH